MKGLFWILGLFALAVAVALGARLNDGYVLLVMPPWRVEISLNFALLLALLTFLLAYASLRALRLAFGLPEAVRDYQQRRQRDRAAAVFQDAVRLLFEGRFGQALKKATEAHAAGTAPGLSALIAARAAQRLREPQKQQGWVARAKLDDPKTEAATLMLEAEMMVEARQFDAALEALGRLQEKHGRHIAALRLELRARQGLGDWDGVLKLVRQLAKRDALPPEVVAEVRTQAHLGALSRRKGDRTQLLNYLKAIPETECSRRVALAAARALFAQGAEEAVQALIERQLAPESAWDWQSELVDVYGRLTQSGQTARIAKAEAWLKGHPKDGLLLLALGRMCVRQKLWGKAQSYLEASLAIRPSRAAHLELARLFDQLERPDDANRHYRASIDQDERPD